MNPNYTEFKFPQIKPHPWSKVFKPRTPPEAIDLVNCLLEYTPGNRTPPLDACAHAFFDELRDPATRLPNGKELPQLFNFTAQEMAIKPSLMNALYPSHAQKSHGMASLPSGSGEPSGSQSSVNQSDGKPTN